MLQAVFTKNVNKIEVSGLTQWDRGRELEVAIPDLPESFEAHFSYKGAGTAYVVEATGTDGTSVIPIPNIILTQRKDAVCWIYYTDGDSGETVKTIYLPIEAREKPSDYVYTESEVLSYKSLEERIKALEKGGASDDAIAEAVSAWLEENPIQSGATEAQAKQIQENTTNISELQATKVDIPETGEVNQVLAISSVDENGKPNGFKAVEQVTGEKGDTGEKGEDGTATDEQVQTAVTTWLDEHPEATTTVEDKSIGLEKFSFISAEKSPSVLYNMANAVYGDDDYTEYFEVPDDTTTLFVVTKHDTTDATAFFRYQVIPKLVCCDSDYAELGTGTWTSNVLGSIESYFITAFTIPSGTKYIKVPKYTESTQYNSDLISEKMQFMRSLIFDGDNTFSESVKSELENCGNFHLVSKTYGNLLKNCIIDDVSGNAMIFGSYQSSYKYTNIEPAKISSQILYVSMKSTSTYGGTAKDLFNNNIAIFAYDENGEFLRMYNSSNNSDKRTLISAMGSSGDFRAYYKYDLEEDVKYIRFTGNRNYISYDDLLTAIVSEDEIKDWYLDNSNAEYLKDDELYDFSYESAENAILDNSYYRFAKIGKLIPTPTDYQYTCWSHNMLHYDSVNDRFVHTMKTNSKHGATDGCLYIAYIEPKTLKASAVSKMMMDDGINHITWGQGFWINADGEYVIIANIGTDRDSESNLHKVVSSDYGTTWTDIGEIVLPEGYEEYYFHSCHRLSSGRILANFDDGSVATTEKTKTEIAYSDDDGLNWSIVTIECEYSSVEQHFFEVGDVVVMIGRKNSYDSSKSHAYIAYSYDDGLTWTKAKESQTIYMHCANAITFQHDGVVELFALSRYYTNTFKVGNFIGEINHYTATEEQALNDQWVLREVFYGTGYNSANFHAPSLAQDSEGNVLISYSDSISTANTPTELHFLYSDRNGNALNPCCDGRASDILPYSGAKVEELIAEVKAMLNS